MSLFKHQTETINFLRKSPLAFVTSDPGTGKTVSCLDVINKDKIKTLVVCPKSIMEAAWGNDLDTFYPDITYGILDRVQVRKDITYLLNLIVNNQVVIINHDAIKLLLSHSQSCPGLLNSFDRLIIDEFTAFKNKNAQRSKAMAKIAEQFTYKILLSGTPTPRDILDIWHPCFILDGGQRLGYNYFGFRSAVCQPIMKGNFKTFVEWKPLPGAVDGVATTLRDITIRHKLEEVIDMPDRIYRTMQITMPKKLRKHYEVMKKHSILQLQSGDITAVNKAVLGNKLLQIASGSIYDNDGIRHSLDSSKYELVTQLVSERKHSLVFYIWQHQCDEMHTLFTKENIIHAIINGKTTQKERSRIIKNYQAGVYQTLLIQPAAAAHGVTLTKSTTTIWCSGTFNLEHFIQANYRDYRIGQKKRTEVIMISYKDTIEQKVYDNLATKKQNQDNLLEILRS